MADRMGRTMMAAGVLVGVALVALVRRDRQTTSSPTPAPGPLSREGPSPDAPPAAAAPDEASSRPPAPIPGPPGPPPTEAVRRAVVDLPPPTGDPFPAVDVLFRPGNPGPGPHGPVVGLVVPPAPMLVAGTFDDAVHVVHGRDHARPRGRRVRRSAGTAVRLASGAVGIACLAAAAVVVLDRPAVDVGEVDLAPVAVAGAATTAATTPVRVVEPPTEPDVEHADGPSTSSGAPSPAVAPRGVAVRPGGATAGHPGADRTIDPAPGVATTAPTPTPAPSPVVDVGVSSGRVDDLPAAVAAPTRLRLPSLDLAVPVVRVGQDDEGRMAVPGDVDDAGWYEFGPAPGEAGNAVVAGHVDSREQGLGAFHRLVDLAVGDRIAVDADDGTTSTWEVAGRALLDKSGLDTASLFRRTGPAQLVLVTCGGNFDRSVRSYDSNLVVVATRSGR